MSVWVSKYPKGPCRAKYPTPMFSVFVGCCWVVCLEPTQKDIKVISTESTEVSGVYLNMVIWWCVGMETNAVHIITEPALRDKVCVCGVVHVNTQEQQNGRSEQLSGCNSNKWNCSTPVLSMFVGCCWVVLVEPIKTPWSSSYKTQDAWVAPSSLRTTCDTANDDLLSIRCGCSNQSMTIK